MGIAVDHLEKGKLAAKSVLMAGAVRAGKCLATGEHPEGSLAELDFERANPYFYRQLVRNMSPQGLAEVAEDAKRALGLPGDGPRAHLYLAREHQNLTRHDSAIEEYDKYLAEQPEDAEARLALARQYLRTGDRERAETAVGGLLELTGEVGSDARLFAAELAVTDSNIERALRLLEELPGTYKELSSYKYLARIIHKF